MHFTRITNEPNWSMKRKDRSSPSPLSGICHARTMKWIATPAGEKIRFVFMEANRRVSVFREGRENPIDNCCLPHWLRQIQSLALFHESLADVYVKARRDGEIGLDILQRGRGGMESGQEFDEVTILNQKLSGFASLDDQNKESVVFQLNYLIEQAHVRVNSQDITLFLGKTGAGKTSLIQYLTGAEIHVRYDDDTQDFVLHFDGGLDQFKVGHGSRSCTKIPIPFQLNRINQLCFDCPGFSDNRGSVQELINASYIHSLLRTANLINLILVLPEECLDDRVHLNLLRESIHALEAYYPDFQKIEKSVLFIFTQGNGQRSRREEFVQSKLEAALATPWLSDYERQCISFITRQKQFLCLFKKLREETPPDKPLIILDEEQERLISSIGGLQPANCQMIARPNMSETTKHKMGELVGWIVGYIEKHVQAYCSQFIARYKKKLDELKEEEAINPIMSSDAFESLKLELADLHHRLKRKFSEKIEGSFDLLETLPDAQEELNAIRKLQGALLVFSQLTGCKLNHDYDEKCQAQLDILSKEAWQIHQEYHAVLQKWPIKFSASIMNVNDVERDLRIGLAKVFEAQKNFPESEENYGRALNSADLPSRIKIYESYVLMLRNSEQNIKSYRAIYSLLTHYKSQKIETQAAILFLKILYEIRDNYKNIEIKLIAYLAFLRSQVTDEGLGLLADVFSDLTSIDMQKCYKITDRGLSALATSFPRLTSLNLSFCHNITDKGLSVLSRNCHELTALDMSNCFNITDTGLSALAGGCHELTALDLSNCNITDAGLSALAVGCQKLYRVNLSKSHKISSNGLLTLIQHCPKLFWIGLHGCKQIKDTELSVLMQNRPKLELDF